MQNIMYNTVMVARNYTTKFSVSALSACLAITILLLPTPTQAAQSSANYKINEDFVGAGSGDSSSANFKVTDTVGAVGIGEAAKTAYRAFSGVPTPDEPRLAFSVDTTSINYGTLNPGLTRTGVAYFSVLNYTTYGYAVTIKGPSLTNSYSHAITPMATAASSAIGTEQFGINLVANTAPATLGADPVQVPDSTFSFGQALSGYNTANVYKYVNGASIVSAAKNSGQTTYTISSIVNISSTTPGGTYSSAQELICTGTY
jgi:hypothetical protein